MKIRTKTALALAAGLFSLSAFVLYNGSNLLGKTHPNISSWLVWGCITLLNFTSYKKLTGDWVKSILPTANSVMCVTTVLLSFRHGSFNRLERTDQICLVLGILAGISWWIIGRHQKKLGKQKDKGAETVVQIMLQITLVIGFIPTIASVAMHSGSEPWVSWMLWTIAFACQFTVIHIAPEKRGIEYLYPVNMFFFHGCVFILALV